MSDLFQKSGILKSLNSSNDGPPGDPQKVGQSIEAGIAPVIPSIEMLDDQSKDAPIARTQVPHEVERFGRQQRVQCLNGHDTQPLSEHHQARCRNARCSCRPNLLGPLADTESRVLHERMAVLSVEISTLEAS